jgi:sn-glycerol 3-phosphate transport system permease protein
VQAATPRRTGARNLEWLEGAVLVAPGALLLGGFLLWPALEALWLSFQQEGLLGRSSRFVGLAQYIEVFTTPANLESAWASLRFALIVAPLEMVLALGAALLIARPFPGVAIYRTLFFLTTAVPTAVAAVAWGWFLHPQGGWANAILETVGVRAQPWLTDSALALPTLAVITAWAGVGFAAILLTAGLQQIPEELYEAARIDGAGSWAQFRAITLPLLSPTLFLVTLLVFLRSLTAFGQIHLLTRGGPEESTTVWIYRVYQDAFFNFRTNYAAAEAVVLFVVLLVLAALQFRFFGKRVHYS